jgi:predicted dehydrogenase
VSRAPLRYAVVGPGAAVFHLHRAAVEAVGGRWVGAASRSGAGAGLGCPTFADHRAMLEACRPDVAVVLTPHDAHAPVAVDCLAAGAHVLLEKPLATTLTDGDAIVRAAARAGRLVAVSFQQRYRPEVAAARHLLAEGALGELQRVVLDASWPRTRAYYRSATWHGTWQGEGGGVLANQGSHQLDLLCHLLGPPAQVTAWTRTLLHEIETEDTVQALLGWEPGPVAELHLTTAGPAGWERFELAGTGGSLVLEHGALRLRRLDDDLRPYVAAASGFKDRPAARELEVALEPALPGHLGPYVDLEAAIREGTPLRSDAASARASLELACAAVLSGSRGAAPVRLPVDPPAYDRAFDALRAAALTRLGSTS